MAEVVHFLEQNIRKRRFVSSAVTALKQDETNKSDLQLLVFAKKRSLSNRNIDHHSPAGGSPPNYEDEGPQKKEHRHKNRVRNLKVTFDKDEEERQENMECEFKEVTVTLTK